MRSFAVVASPAPLVGDRRLGGGVLPLTGVSLVVGGNALAPDVR